MLRQKHACAGGCVVAAACVRIMNRVLSYVFGPEMYWAVMYVLARMAARRHLAPDPAITGWLDRYWIMLPLICVPLTFAFFLLPGGGR